ncbi:conserved hypothetical protein [Candidatus Nitrotoga fabula]|uniref:Uncharacterized protein n=1 Tax=Candidatus Nitrotoga fabula TaxID=2182327 RepID=A0A916BGX9_9PROT|nr:conserved hypothetical protein [Candidatus Nitrotoga fabula]
MVVAAVANHYELNPKTSRIVDLQAGLLVILVAEKWHQTHLLSGSSSIRIRD